MYMYGLVRYNQKWKPIRLNRANRLETNCKSCPDYNVQQDLVWIDMVWFV